MLFFSAKYITARGSEGLHVCPCFSVEDLHCVPTRLYLLFSRGSPLRSDKTVLTFQPRISGALRQACPCFSVEDLRCSPTSPVLTHIGIPEICSRQECLFYRAGGGPSNQV